MAAPHVAGAWAVVKSKYPSAGVDQVLAALSSTGVPVLDSRNGITKPRIQVDAAMSALAGAPAAQFTTGTAVTVNATPNPGFRVKGWSGCDSFSGNTCTLTVNSDRTVTASFEANTASPPVIVSQSVTGATQNAAQLNATVNPNGSSTTVYFQWGTTAAYGSQTTYQFIGSGTGAVSLSFPLTGLSPGTTYYYRVVAGNASGSTTGTGGIFATTPGWNPSASCHAASRPAQIRSASGPRPVADAASVASA